MKYNMLLIDKLSGEAEFIYDIPNLIDLRRIACSYFDSYSVYVYRILEDGFIMSCLNDEYEC